MNKHLRMAKKEEKIHVWMSPKLKDDTYRQAQKREMNISEYVRFLIRKDGELNKVMVN